jgi:hypothetical protein
MDDLMTVRFALDNVHPPELATRAREALDRIIESRPIADRGGEAQSSARMPSMPEPASEQVRPADAA